MVIVSAVAFDSPKAAVRLAQSIDHDDPAAVQNVQPNAAPIPSAPASAGLFGMRFEEMSAEVRARFSIRSTINGLVVTDVDASSEAASRRIKSGDVIVEANQVGIGSEAEFEQVTKTLQNAGKVSVLILVSSNIGELRFVALPLR
jgi:serine protease Do